MYESGLLTTREIVEMFGVSIDTLHRWVNAGKVPYAALPNGRRRYWEADIRAIIAGIPLRKPE